MSEGLLPSVDKDPTVTRPALQISYDSDRDFLWALVPGAVIDGQMEDEVEEHLDGLFVYRRGPEGPVIGFGVDEAFAWDVMGNLEDEPEVVWGGKLRFDAPTLALRDASIGEVVLAAQATISSSTPDVILFDLAVAAGCQEQWDDAEGLWRACLEAGDMKAHFGLGYTLVELGRPREAFGHLRMYTEINPRNSWAWLWRGRAAEDMGELEEAKQSYARALEAEEDGSYETDADERLARLGQGG